MTHAAAVPAFGSKYTGFSSERCWTSRPNSGATLPWTGRFPYCRSTCGAAPASGSPMTPSAGNCGGNATCGSGPATSWTPTPSWRKKRRLRRQIRALPPRTALLAEDETDLLLFPPLRACWSPRGQPKEVHLSGRNARRVVFGALNLRSGHRLLLAREHQRAGDYQAFVEMVHLSYRGWPVALLQDEDPSHTAAGSVRLAELLGIQLLWLPKRSPKLNPMDTLWGQAKDVISANKQYATIDDQVERFLSHLEGLSRQEALHTAGVQSKDFWLKSVL
jgi:hypothetical protein